MAKKPSYLYQWPDRSFDEIWEESTFEEVSAMGSRLATDLHPMSPRSVQPMSDLTRDPIERRRRKRREPWEGRATFWTSMDRYVSSARSKMVLLEEREKMSRGRGVRESTAIAALENNGVEHLYSYAPGDGKRRHVFRNGSPGGLVLKGIAELEAFAAAVIAQKRRNDDGEE